MIENILSSIVFRHVKIQLDRSQKETKLKYILNGQRNVHIISL